MRRPHRMAITLVAGLSVLTANNAPAIAGDNDAKNITIADPAVRAWNRKIDPQSGAQKKRPKLKKSILPQSKNKSKRAANPAPSPDMNPTKTAPDPSAPNAAYDAYQEGRYGAAMRIAQRFAEKGSAPAHTLIARIHAEGRGVPKDQNLAARWYQRAAELGDPHAKLGLGLMLLRGEGVIRDRTIAAQLLKEAADAGIADAQYNRALIIIQSDGKLGSMDEAVGLLTRAAQQNLASAQYDLGTLLAQGNGIETDVEKAARWTGAAAQNGLPEAQLEYAIMLVKGKGVEKNPVEAARYLQAAASANNPVAQNRLARLYALGIGVEPSTERAAKWHLIARRQGVSDIKLDIMIKAMPKDERARARTAAQLFLDNRGL